MSISSNYNHLETEKKWYSYWMKNDYFSSIPADREPYTIVIPPPNITGVISGCLERLRASLHQTIFPTPAFGLRPRHQ